MHDTIKLEGLGVAAVPVATHEFMLPARAQASVLGRPDFDAVYVPHPIQDQTPAEIQARAVPTVNPQRRQTAASPRANPAFTQVLRSSGRGSTAVPSSPRRGHGLFRLVVPMAAAATVSAEWQAFWPLASVTSC